MSDLERQLEELFMSDSRARRVDQVNVPTARRGRFGGVAFVGGVAMAALALIVGFSLLRGGTENVPASSPTPSGSAAVAASPNPSASAVPGEQVICGQVSRFNRSTPTAPGSFVITPSGQSGTYVVLPAGVQGEFGGYVCAAVKTLPQGAPSIVFVGLLAPGRPGYVAEGAASAAPSATSGPSTVRPDAGRGFIARGTGEGVGVMRTESDAAVLKSFPRELSAATTRDGLRVAYFRTGQTGTQLVTFDTAGPGAEKTVVDFSGSGEVTGEVVWSSDQANELLISVSKLGPQVNPEVAVVYSSLRVVDAGTGAVREIARITSGLYLRPLAWHGASNTAAALEWSPAGGFAANYDYIRAGVVTRTPFSFGQVIASTVRADVDGQRVLSIGGLPAPRGVTWWPIDRFDARRELKADPAYDVSVALWRAGTDEIVVYASPMTKAPGAAPRLEAWTTSDQRRTIAEGAGPLGILRVDGSAAITTAWTLVDLRTGATTDIPGANRDQIPYLAVKF